MTIWLSGSDKVIIGGSVAGCQGEELFRFWVFFPFLDLGEIRNAHARTGSGLFERHTLFKPQVSST